MFRRSLNRPNRRPRRSRHNRVLWWSIEFLLLPLALVLWLTWPQGAPPTPRAVLLWAAELLRAVAGR